MAEERLKRNLDAAFDPGPDFPGHLWLSRTMALLGSEAPPLRRSGRFRQPPRLLPLVAVVLVIAIVATLLVAGRLLHSKQTVPSRHAPGAAACATNEPGPFPASMGAQPVEPLPPAPVLMSTSAIAWAGGGLRTTDGGHHWADVSPAALREGMDTSSIANGSYPPSFADFYLDGNHAWEIRTYESGTACDDHFVTFETSDGGRIWRQSATVTLDLPPGYGIPHGLNSGYGRPSIQLYFTDAKNGWVWVPMGPPSGEFAGPQAIEGTLYRSQDGGLSWYRVSHITSSSTGISQSACRSTSDGSMFGTIRFLNADLGWMSLTCQLASVLVTRDGGNSWKLEPLPVPSMLPPMFFNETAGILQTDRGQLFTTRDGGATWHAIQTPIPSAPSATYSFTASEFWGVVNAPYAGLSWLYRSVDGGETWSQVSGDLGVAQVVSIAFSDLAHGLMLGLESGHPCCDNYVLLSTTDGGRTWETIVPTVQRAS